MLFGINGYHVLNVAITSVAGTFMGMSSAKHLAKNNLSIRYVHNHLQTPACVIFGTIVYGLTGVAANNFFKQIHTWMILKIAGQAALQLGSGTLIIVVVHLMAVKMLSYQKE